MKMKHLFLAFALAFMPATADAQSANPFNPDYAFCNTVGAIASRLATVWGCVTPGANGQVLKSNGPGAVPSWLTVTGTGTVTSVGLALPSEITVTGSPVTAAGTLTGAWTNQAANLFLASPNGASGAPTFRGILPADFGSQSPKLFLAGPPSVAGVPTFRTIQNTDFASQAANLIFASPNGSAGNPVYRSIVGADFGSQSANTILAAPNGSAGNPTYRSIVGADFGSQTGNTFLAAPNGSTGNPAYRAMVAEDLPNAGVASGGNVTGTWPSLTATISTPDFQNGFRISAESANPVIASTTSLSTSTIYAVPYNGNVMTLWNGTAYVPTTCSSAISQTLSDTTKSPAAAVANTNYDLFAWLDAGTCRVTRGPAWTNANTRSAALDRTTIGTPVNAVAITNGPAAFRGIYMGTIRTDASATVTFFSGADGGASCTPVSNGIWNYFNRVRQSFLLRASSMTDISSASSTPTTWTNCKMDYVRGLAYEPISANLSGVISMGASTVGSLNSTVTCATADTSLNGLIGAQTGGSGEMQSIGQMDFTKQAATEIGLCTVTAAFTASPAGVSTFKVGKSFMQVTVSY